MSLEDFDIQEIKEDNKSKKKHLIFLLNDKRYALPLSKIKEVIRVTNITPLPGVVPFYKGLINIRGQIISVIDLRTLLGIETQTLDAKRNAIIISQVGEILVGAIVDKVEEVRAYDRSEMNISDTGRMEMAGAGVYGVAKDQSGELTLLIDLEKAVENTDFKTIDKEQRQGADETEESAA